MKSLTSFTVYLGLGSNLGDSQQTLQDAIICLAQQGCVSIEKQSSFYQSAPVDAPGDDYLNCVIQICTPLCATQLLELIQKIEHHFGRKRAYHHAPRTLDIDILLYDQLQIQQPHLTLPHPRMHLRAFVLYPLLELSPNIEIPGLGSAQAFVQQVQSQAIYKCCAPCFCKKRTPHASS